jgi:hypothetical protein
MKPCCYHHTALGISEFRFHNSWVVLVLSAPRLQLSFVVVGRGAGVVCTKTAVVLCCRGSTQNGISLLVSSTRSGHGLQSARSDLSVSVEVPSGQRMHFSLGFKPTPSWENS